MSLLIAFSPVLQDLAVSLIANPEQRYVLLPMLWAVLALAEESRRRVAPHPILGGGVVAAGLVAELVGIASSSLFIARIGFPIAVCGTGLILGHRLPFSLPLLLASIPVPEFIVYSTSPVLESRLARWAGDLVALAGASLEVAGPLFKAGSRRLELFGYDSGIVTAILLAATAWFGSFRSGLGWRRSALRSLAIACLTMILQPVLVLMAALSLLWGFPVLGGFLLRYGVAVALGLWTILRIPIRVSHPATPGPAEEVGNP